MTEMRNSTLDAFKFIACFLVLFKKYFSDFDWCI